MDRLVIGLCAIVVVGCGSTFKPGGDADLDVVPDGTHDTAVDPAEDPVEEPAADMETDAVVEDVPVEVIEDVVPDSTGPCSTDSDCMMGLHCCSGRCVNFHRDPENCGGCGTACRAPSRFCDMGSCTRPPCDSGTYCTGITFCCGENCCEMAQICCIVETAGPWGGPECYDDFCPGGCPMCD